MQWIELPYHVVDGSALLFHFGQGIFEGRRRPGDQEGRVATAQWRPEGVAHRRQRRRRFRRRRTDRCRHDGRRLFGRRHRRAQRRPVEELGRAEGQRLHWCQKQLLLGCHVHLLEGSRQVGRLVLVLAVCVVLAAAAAVVGRRRIPTVQEVPMMDVSTTRMQS